MKASRKQRWQQLQSVFEPGFGRMLLVSLLLHILLPGLYFSPLFPKGEPLKPPVYRVNLVNKPVKNPQAGRPEAVVTQKKKAPPKPKAKPKPVPPKPKAKPIPPKPEPVKPKPVKPKPVKPKPVKPKPVKPKPVKPKPVKPKPVKPKPVKPKPVKPKPVKPKAKPKPTPKPVPKPAVSKTQENARQKRLEQLRAKAQKRKAEEERKARIDALKAAAAAQSQQIESPIKDAPVGMLDGKGDEAGDSAAAFVREYIQQQWRYSQYQSSGSPEAEVLLFYNAAGTLQHYRFLEKSGNSIFDESLTRAINKSKQLNQPLPEAMEFHIVFNLKEMLDRR